MKKFSGVLIFLLALILFGVTLSPGPFPGESAAAIAQYAGVDPFAPIMHPLYTAMARVAAMLPAAGLAFRLNAINAALGALSLWIVYVLASRVAHERTQEEALLEFNEGFARGVSGWAAVAILGLTIPFWVISTRAHTAALDVFIILLAVLFLSEFRRTQKFFWLALGSFVWGLGTTETATCIVLAPLFGVIAIYSLWRAEKLNAGRVFSLIGCGLLGLTPYLLHAAWYMSSPAYEWREFHSYWEVLHQMLYVQYVMIIGGMPRHGWLTVWIMTFVPWLVVFASRIPGRSNRSRAARIGSYLLNLVLTAILVAIIYDARISPWALTRDRPLLITPYLFVALWGGYLAGYWYAVLAGRDRHVRSAPSTLKRLAGVIYVPLMAALLLAPAVLNWPVANGRGGQLTSRVADIVLDSMEGRKWLVSNGILDAQIRIRSYERGLNVNMISSASSGPANAYTRYLATLFDDLRLKGLALIGPGPLTHELISRNTNVTSELAILANADLWYAGGYEPLPDRVLFLGVHPGRPVDIPKLLARQAPVWDLMTLAAHKPGRAKNLSAPWDGWILMHMSRVVNNLGVFLEDRGETNEAFACYIRSRTFDTNNISALVNAHSLAKRADRPEAPALEQQLVVLSKKLQGSMRMAMALSYNYGYIRNAELYAARGMAWAMTGKPNLAAGDIKRALVMSGQDDASGDLAMASLYFAQEMGEESSQAYLAALQKDPNNTQALFGLLHLAMSRGDIEGARSYLDRLADLKVASSALKMERAGLETLTGNRKEAIALLNQVVQQDPGQTRAWAALAMLAAEASDKDLLNRAMEKLRTTRALSPGVRLAMVRVAMAQGDRDAARKQLDDLIRVDPGNVKALETLLRLDVYQGRRDAAEQHIDQLLTVAPRNALANYILGTLQVYRDQYALAETSFRVSMEASRSPEVLNDMAWLLARRGAMDESLKLVRESLKLEDRNPAAWDTYGNIMLEKGDVAEAERAIQKALSLTPNQAPLLLSMAKVYEKKGMLDESQRLVNDLLARPSVLNRESFDELRALSERLRNAR